VVTVSWSVTNGELIKTAERRAFVLNLRRSGATYAFIAEAARKHFGEDQLPQGWDCRYAYKDVKRELQKIRDDIGEAVEEIRTLELERLDSLLQELWPIVHPPVSATQNEEDESLVYDVDTRLRTVDRILKIMDRRLSLVPDLATAAPLNLLSGGKPISIREVVVNLTDETQSAVED